MHFIANNLLDCKIKYANVEDKFAVIKIKRNEEIDLFSFLAYK